MMFAFVLVVICVTTFAYYLYRKGTENVDYFKNSGVQNPRSIFALGNIGELLFQRMTLFEFADKWYNHLPDERAVGLLDMRSPVLLIRDPALAKQLVVKEFDHFVDHRVFVTEKMDTLFGNSLVSLTGQKWRDMRATLSPAFTGSKMKLMFELIVEVCEQMVLHIKNENPMTENTVEFEMKDFCSRFTNDVIAMCAFGIKVNSLKDQNNEFFTAGKEVMDFSSMRQKWRIMGLRFLPGLMKFFGFQLINETIRRFFKDMILTTIRIREENNIIRPDMIHQLIEVRKGTLTHKTDERSIDEGFATVQESESVGKETNKRTWSDDELIAQCFLFFLAGFETSSTAMSFAIYELAVNPEVQEKLYLEIKQMNDSLNGKPINYDTLNSMKYLDMVISEVLRKRPATPFTDRKCVKDLKFKDDKGFEYHFKRNLSIWIPIHSYHNDPKYFPNPERFDPERFSDENKHLIDQDAYIPFGLGPRNCIGCRFALMELKALVYYLILNFNISVISKTQIPLTFKRTFGNIITEHGIWVGMTSRN